MPRSVLRIGTRPDALALAQAESVRRAIQEIITRRNFELVPMVTVADGLPSSSLPPLGAEGIATFEISLALAEAKIDLVVHDARDYPFSCPDGVVLASVPARIDPREAVLTRRGSPFATLQPGSRVGVASYRRAAQVASLRRGLVAVPSVGPLDIILRTLTSGDVDALIVDVAGLRRLGKDHRISEILTIDDFVPAPGQGCLVVECRAGDRDMRAALAKIEDPGTRRAFDTERAFVAELGGDVSAPIAAIAKLDGLSIKLRALIGSVEGGRVIRDMETGDDPVAVASVLAERMMSSGATELLAAAVTA